MERETGGTVKSEQTGKSAPTPGSPCFVFDVESIGLHGEGFAVAGGVYQAGEPLGEFCFSCPPDIASGDDEGRKWVVANVASLTPTHANPVEVRDAFWQAWQAAKLKYPKIEMYGECLWPVEAGFLSACVRDKPGPRTWGGPYPFHEIASIMKAAGMDPMATYERTERESPAHHPLADARLSARLLYEALP
jgi:hypothetical protein